MAASGFTFGASSNSTATTKPAFSFGAPSSNANPLSGFGAAKSTSTGFSFGTAQQTTAPATGFSFGGAAAAAAPASKPSTGFSFGAAPTATTTSKPSTGFSFGTPASAATTSASTGLGGGLFGSTSAAGTGLSLFGAKTTAATTGLTFGSTTSKSATTGFGFGATAATSATSLGFGAATTTTAAPSTEKTPENVKEAIVPAEITTLVDNLEKYIKEQKSIKDEISKISSEQMTKTREELKDLHQAVALIGNALQRNSIAVENLKLAVNQELKNGEVCHRTNQIAGNFQHDFNVPIQYFQRLVFSFESRIGNYRQELEELEAFLTSTSPVHNFSPQDLSNIFKRLNDSFIALASELYQVHEQIKVLKEKYLQFRRVLYGDASDPFASRKKKALPSGTHKTLGPSPFPVVQGAGIMASAFKTEQRSATTIGKTLPKTITFGTSNYTKPTGLTRSLSFDGSANKSLGGSLSTGGSLFNKPTLGGTSSLNSTGTFTLQQPPSGKRGRIL